MPVGFAKISLARPIFFSKANVSSFFKNYKELLARGNFISEKFGIVTSPESGLRTVHVLPKIIGSKGMKQLSQMTSGERGQNIILIASINAIGNYIPPMMVLPGVNFRPHMVKGCSIGTVGGANPSSWSNERLFLEYLKHFKV